MKEVRGSKNIFKYNPYTIRKKTNKFNLTKTLCN